jgi:hypothetical protein
MVEHFSLFVFFPWQSVLKHTNMEICTSICHQQQEQLIKLHNHQLVKQVSWNVIVTACFEVLPHLTTLNAVVKGRYETRASFFRRQELRVQKRQTTDGENTT